MYGSKKSQVGGLNTRPQCYQPTVIPIHGVTNHMGHFEIEWDQQLWCGYQGVEDPSRRCGKLTQSKHYRVALGVKHICNFVDQNQGQISMGKLVQRSLCVVFHNNKFHGEGYQHGDQRRKIPFIVATLLEIQKLWVCLLQVHIVFLPGGLCTSITIFQTWI